MQKKNVLQEDKFSPALSVTLLLPTLFVLLVSALPSSAWAATKFKTVHQFKAPGPVGGLISDSAGNLYGTTVGGGTDGFGTVFELSPDGSGGWKEKLLHSFTYRGGTNPYGSLVFDSAGNLYGTTQNGGSLNACQKHGCGVVFELSPNGTGGWTEKVLHTFQDGQDGFNPFAGLTLDSAGNLYGTTYFGGANCRCGTVFELSPKSDGTWTEKVIHSFNDNGTDGYFPYAGVILDSAGNLYGTTVAGLNAMTGGTVFRLSPGKDGSWKESVLHSFGSYGKHGGQPYGGLIFDSSGNLYGTTLGGGPYHSGAVFELTPNGDGIWPVTVLHSFTGSSRYSTDGSHPHDSLIFDSAGNLYGTTLDGGNFANCGGGCGVVFELKPNQRGGWNETLLHMFNGTLGFYPFSGVILDGQGNVYGTTFADGVSPGTVFEVSP
jgi:uncharacterized repeat protein (TIGR03803 family)